MIRSEHMKSCLTAQIRLMLFKGPGQICSVFNFQILFCEFFFLFAAHRLMIQCVNRQCAVQKRKKNMRLAAAFCLFMGTSPISFGLIGGNGSTLKLEMTTKLKDKQTSIATVRDLLRTFATFSASPLFSHCRLPLKIFTNQYR